MGRLALKARINADIFFQVKRGSRVFKHNGDPSDALSALARKNHALGESTSSLRARKLLNRRWASA